MIPNHEQFIAAIRDKKLIRIRYYSKPDADTVDRECAPIGYGPSSDDAEGINRYWVWDQTAAEKTNPIGLLPGQILSVQVLGLGFDPALLPKVPAGIGHAKGVPDPKA